MQPPLAAFAEWNMIEKIRMAEGAWSRCDRRQALRDTRGLPSGRLRQAMGLGFATSLDEWSTVVATN